MREQRLVFGEAADLYDRFRPSYPAALIDDVVELAGGPAAEVLEVGCGTGKASVLLAGRGVSGTGVEADPSMAEVARRNLSGYPRWSVEVSDFEAWSPAEANSRYDLVYAAQAWHWIDPAIRFHKAHSLLRDRGWLALWWNKPERDESDLRARMDDVYERLAPDLASRGMQNGDQDRHDEVPDGVAFGEPLRRFYRWERDYTAEEWTSLMRTQSNHRLLDPALLERILSELGEVIRDHGGVYHHPYFCRLWAAPRGD